MSTMFSYFIMGSVKCRLWTDCIPLFFTRVRKQWGYCCHVLICMVKAIVCSLRFTLTDVFFRKWHLKGTYLKFFSSGACPKTPLVACTFGFCGRGYAAPQTPFFSVDMVGVSAVATLWPREMVTSPC